MHRIAALFVVMLLVLSGGGNFAEPVPVTPVPLLPIPGTPQAPDPLGGFRGIQPTPPAVTPGPAGVSRLPDIQYSEFFQDDIVDFAGQFLQPRTAPDGRRAIPIHSQQLVNLPFGYVQDLTFSARVTLTSGAFQVSVRQSGAGEYRAMADTSGLVVLQRAGQTLATAQLPASHRFEYGVLLTVTAAGPRIEVRVGTDVVIAYDDPQPLPYGVISFSGMDFAPTSGWLSELTLSANVARDLDAGAALIESLSAQRETRQNQPLPDLGRIYFTRTSNGTSAIWSIKPDGSDSRVVVENATFGDISTDGRRLAFISNRDGAFRLWVKLAEGVLFQLSKEVSPVTHQNPSWSYDNVRVAFIRDGSLSGEGTSIWIHDMRRATTSLYPTNESIHPARIDWSPDSDAIVYVNSSLSDAYELIPDGTSRPISNTIPNMWSVKAIAYGPTSETAFVVHQNFPTSPPLHNVSRIDLDPNPSATFLAEIRNSGGIPIVPAGDLAISPDGQTIAVQIEPGTYSDPHIIFLSASGTLLPQTISNASFSISWSGSAEFAETFERCVSVPVPTQGVALRPDLTQAPPAIGTPLPPDTRMEFTGRVIDQAMTPWLEVNAVMPQYATTPTPEATYATPYWVSAAAFSEGGVYLDPCDDDPLINDPAAGNASDSYYLPLLQQPERTLTPTYTPTLHPGCYLHVPDGWDDARVRSYPLVGATTNVLANLSSQDAPTLVTGVSVQQMYGYYWYQVYDPDGWSGTPETQIGWVADSTVELLGTYECEVLMPFDATVTPIVALPTYTPSPSRTPAFTPTYGTTPTRIPRIVVTQAQPLHAMADQIGLPLPFEVWPRATALPTSDYYQQGYGPNRAAYNQCRGDEPTVFCQYRFTGRIHQGLDYYVLDDFAPPASCAATPEYGKGVVYAVCSGVIVEGYRDGGTGLDNDWVNGLSLRCFSDDPTDPDGDGNPNLSNLVIVYNHLFDDPKSMPSEFYVAPDSGRVVEAGEAIGYTSQYLTSQNQCAEAHLDMQAVLAEGYGHWTTTDPASVVQVNPLLLFATTLSNRHYEGSLYASLTYPDGYGPYSLQGNLLSLGTLNFWTNPNQGLPFIDDIAEYLTTVPIYGTPSYVGPNCTEYYEDGNVYCEITP